MQGYEKQLAEVELHLRFKSYNTKMEVALSRDSFSEVTPKQYRNNFIGKVYSILALQLTITSVVCGLVVTIEELKHAILKSYPIMYSALGVSLVVLVTLVCVPAAAKKFPTNYTLLGIFTVLEAYVLGYLCASSNSKLVLVAFLMTLGVSISLSIYAFKTKKDFNTKQAMLCALATALVVCGVFLVVFGELWARLLYCFLGVLVFSMFIVYDTQLIAGGRHSQLTYEDYIVGALVLYIDVVGLFVYLLSLVGTGRQS
mmetsp:Transcript_7256/g.10721  ORF Transcript_7256/g.10721 Transcript_7256/m.10721 type:complete len:257 (-) Transcript_7256:21-791(-)